MVRMTSGPSTPRDIIEAFHEGTIPAPTLVDVASRTDISGSDVDVVRELIGVVMWAVTGRNGEFDMSDISWAGEGDDVAAIYELYREEAAVVVNWDYESWPELEINLMSGNILTPDTTTDLRNLGHTLEGMIARWREMYPRYHEDDGNRI